MRDNSPSYEPTADMARLAYIPSEDCDSCHGTDDLREDSGFTLCRKCRRIEAERA